MSERALRAIRNKGAMPHRKHFVVVAWAAVEFTQERREQSGAEIEAFSAAVIQYDISRQQIGMMPLRC